MRRIIHNTTAIAACLSLLAPHVAMAQDAATDEIIQEQPAEEAAEPTEEAVQPPEAEIGQPLAEEPAADEATADPEPADAEPTEGTEPEGAATPEESVDMDAFEEDPDAQPAEAPNEQSGSQNDAQAEVAAPTDDDAGAGEATPDDAGAEALSEPTPTDGAPETVEDEAVGEPAATQADPTDAEIPNDEGDLAKALAEEQAKQEATDTEPAETEPAADSATDDTPTEDAAPDEADPEAETPDQDGDTADTPVTPLDEAIPTDDAETGAADDAAMDGDAQDEAAADDRAPEDGAQETEAAREAAEAADTPTAAALSDEAGEGEVTAEEVTEENSRSSDEDFATSLRDALGAATGGTTAAADDDNGNDLAKALLLGLGGVAVGAMLTNNREVTLSSPDRVVVTRPDGSQQVIKDEVALLRQPGSTVTTENFADGSSRTIVARADGSQVVTIRDADLRVLRRTLVTADGSSVPLIDDTATEAVDISSLPAPAAVTTRGTGQMDEDQLREALLREANVTRGFTLGQIRNIPQVRALVAPVNIDAITFDTGSAAISPDQAQQLSMLGNVIRDTVAENPREIFLIEGHTDTVGSDAANLALSDRRAESVALALSEYFDVPAENMVVQGYGEQFLQVRREGDVRENRRASVRRITSLLQGAE